MLSHDDIVLSVTQVTATLYTFIDDTRHVDKNVSELIDEIRSLSQILDTISKSLGNNALVASSSANSSLWVNVHSSMQECQDTIKRLDQMLRDLGDSAPSASSFLRKSKKQVKLNMRSKDVAAFKQQIHTHCSGMQLTLQTVNVYGPKLYHCVRAVH